MHVAVMQRTGPKTAVSLLELDRNAVTAAAAGSGGGALVQPPRFAAPSRPVYELDASTGVVSSSRHPFRPEGQCVCVCVCVCVQYNPATCATNSTSAHCGRVVCPLLLCQRVLLACIAASLWLQIDSRLSMRTAALTTATATRLVYRPVPRCGDAAVLLAMFADALLC
jgi:hypothetical protein